MVILNIDKEKMKALNPCVDELMSGGMKIIEVVECILAKIPTEQLEVINKRLMDEIANLAIEKDKINNMYTEKGV